jgi:hypothetical protein
MALTDLGSIVLQLLIFITTLVNFSYALQHIDVVLILLLYLASKLFYLPPETGMISRCQFQNLYHDV